MAKANVDAVRNTFLEMLLPIVDRVLCKKGEVGLYDTYYKKDDAKAATYREVSSEGPMNDRIALEIFA